MRSVTSAQSGAIHGINSKSPAKVSALPGRSALDGELMSRVIGSADRDAFNTLAIHYAPRLKAWLMHRGEGDSTSEDIVQDVLTAVWQKAASYDSSKASFSTWVFRMTRNRWIDHKRKHDRLQPTAPQDMVELADEPEDSPHAGLEEAEAAQAVREALATLPPEQKQMLYLAFFEGLSHSAIAERTGIAIGTVKSRIRAPLKKLRTTLEAYRKDEP
ncbi:sigma-70 family RNA polymerase sigma factor [uncultured Hyphomonas sp.]|uniref:sigma-70 family RNA polymerase sigma factor n=1 Tax=uncultured Hyphomonas sp. TaxID=225298 RepID=UPI002AAB9F80|nr:sigma-70 family RNA polymerase sigma factor [uncultured Hyphomonas sp.]